MNGLVSLLPQPHYDQVKQFWEDLESRFGVQSDPMKQYPPHISWLTVNDYPLKQLESEFRTFAANFRPFTIQTSGIGIFTHPKPVAYISVIKDDAMTLFHHHIWQIAQERIPADQVSQLYSPKLWQPHITLINIDPAPKNLGEILIDLSFSPFQWEMTVDHLAFLCPQTGTLDLQLCRIPLGNDKKPKTPVQ
jgi:2'-5' RNA ligase